MKPTQERLPRANTIRTYAEVMAWMMQFVSGSFNLLFFIGNPGLGKSQLALKALGDNAHGWIEGHATTLAMYIKLFVHRDQPIIIDDESTFARDAGKVSMMSSLCQTNATKTLRWDSTTRILEEYGVPSRFNTSSPVLMITNQLRNLNLQVSALINRGQPLIFEPSAAEIHIAAAEWFSDKEIYDFIGQWLPAIPGVTMRDYIHARELKNAGFDWRTLLHKQWKSSRLAALADLLADPSFATEEQRVQAYVGKGYSKSTYYRDLKRLRRLGTVPPRLAG
jgi:hypothetical protein